MLPRLLNCFMRRKLRPTVCMLFRILSVAAFVTFYAFVVAAKSWCTTFVAGQQV